MKKKRKKGIFPKGLAHFFLSKNWIFSHFFILGKIGKEKVFDDIVEGKKVFVDYKTKQLKKFLKIDLFPRGSFPGFGQKMGFFSIFSFLAK